MGIPQGIKKLQGATRNRRGNTPNLEPKPPMRAIADPRNLESPDPAIKKAAEVKTAEDLKKQKIKAIKFLAGMGCGCYDADGGVTAALVASLNDCTEDVRMATIDALVEAAEQGACASCGQGCCCKKELLIALAQRAYERTDNGCYLEPSEEVRRAAAEALETCCPNDSPPVIEAPETPPPRVQRETGESIQPGDSREGGSVLPPPPPTLPQTPPLDPSAGSLPNGTGLTQLPPVTPPSFNEFLLPSSAADGDEGYGLGVLLHISPQHGLAHVHFNEPNFEANVGAELGVYSQIGQERAFLAKLKVVESFPGSANVTGSAEALAKVTRGDVVLLPPPSAKSRSEDSSDAEWISSFDVPSEPIVLPVAAVETEIPVEDKVAPAATEGAVRPAQQKVAPTTRPRKRPSESPALQKPSSVRKPLYSGFVR
jgi:hypothetical protein